MDKFVNKRITILVSLVFTGIILAFNGYLVVSGILSSKSNIIRQLPSRISRPDSDRTMFKKIPGELVL
jgi:hypothetical protein